MVNETQSLVLTQDPVRGPSSDQEDAWLAARRQGVTATEVAMLAKGNPGDWRRLLIEKVTGERSFTGNQYTEHGHKREPHIALWVADRYAIAPNRNVWMTNAGRYMATPDGVAFTGSPLCEIKTSKYDLNPGLPGGYFEKTGYYDQMQFQMLVMNADETLFVWEQHTDRWPNPAPLFEEPGAAWISRDPERIDHLIEVADRFLLELEAAQTNGLPPAGGLEPDIADLVHELLQARNQEAVGKARREAVWKELQMFLAPGFAGENEEAKVTYSEKQTTVAEFDEAGMAEAEGEFMAAWSRMKAMYEAKREAYTVEKVVAKATLSVTAKKSRG